MSGAGFLIYGATGYTGALVARQAKARGLAPILAGRDPTRVEALAASLGLPFRSFGLEDPRALRRGIDGAAAILHCAGPFSRTSQAMADACLERRAHYLDITGEAVVFEALAARDAEAKQAGIMLLPGAGFDVVPSDCLAAHLKRRLPGATRLVLAFHASGATLSHGTATTLVENLAHGGLVRKGGQLTRVPSAWKTRHIDYGRGPRLSVTIPWGDVSTAFRSTGIGDIEVYTAASAWTVAGLRASRGFSSLLMRPTVQAFLKKRIDARPAGPDETQRMRGRCFLWGEAGGGEHRVASRLQTPEGYALTALTAVAAVEKVLSGGARVGFQTPSTAFGADFVLEIPGVAREDA